MIFFIALMGCGAKEPFVAPRPWDESVQTPPAPKEKESEREDEIRPADEALILLVPEEVHSVTLTNCKRDRKSVRHGQVRFFDVPNKPCRVRFSPSGLFTSVDGGVGVHHCTLIGSSSVICKLSLEGLNALPDYYQPDYQQK